MAVPPAVSASLYVGDLDTDVTEAQLYDLFSSLGPVASIRVCRDSVSHRSLGYAYVNYNASSNETFAAHALETLNYTHINGRPIRIMWSHRDPSARKSGLGNLFVKNLPDSIDSRSLHNLFSPYGKILSSKVAMQDWHSRGYGFVQFETEEAAALAVENLNERIIEKKKLYVAKFIRRSDRSFNSAELMFTNIYVKNIDHEITEEKLQEEFSKFGKIINLIIMKDESGNSKGFGFVNFGKPEDAKKAVEGMNGVQIGSKVLHAGRAQKKAEREQILRRQFEEKRSEHIQKYQGSNVYVKNLDDVVDDEYLYKHFSLYGTIISAKVMKDDKGISKGFGFVCFSSPDEAMKAITDSHGSMHFGKPIYVAFAQPKEVRRAHLGQLYAQRVGGISGSPGAMVPSPYPPMFFTAPPGVMGPLPQRQGLIYAVGMRPGWRPASVPAPGRPGFQQIPALPMISSGPRQQRQFRGRVNGQAHLQAGQLPMLVPLQQQPPQSQIPVAYKDAARNQQHRPKQPSKYIANGRGRDSPVNLSQQPGIASGLMSPSGMIANGQSTNLAEWSSMLANAPPQQQKQMLGERLFPLVQQLQFDLAGKITGMLLEMDNYELLLLLESPEALASKVEEAVQVLHQHTKASHDALSDVANKQLLPDI